MGSLPCQLGARRLKVLRSRISGYAHTPGGSMSFATGLKTIVVATDLQGQSEAALEYARKLAVNYGARIVLAHGADPLEYAAIEGLPGQIESALAADARAALDKLTGDLLCEG